MARILALLLLTAVVGIQIAAAIQCYTCIGYVATLPENSLTNNPNCVSNSFSSSKVQTQTIPNGMCTAYTLWDGTESITVRSALVTRSYSAAISGYVCDGNLCNDKDTNAAGHPSILLQLLVVPALLLRLMA